MGTGPENRLANLLLLIEREGANGGKRGAQKRFAERVGIVAAHLSQMATQQRGVGNDVARRIEESLKLPRGTMDLPELGNAILWGQNVVAGPNFKGLVPVISWVAAGSWADAADPYAVGDAQEWLPCPVRCGPRTFALRVRGLSMFNPTGKPSFDDADIVFIDPDVVPAPNTRTMQSCVVVRLEDQVETTFKQIIEEGSRRYLRALNPAWPEQIIEVNTNATICGSCIGKWVE